MLIKKAYNNKGIYFVGGCQSNPSGWSDPPAAPPTLSELRSNV